MKETKRKTEITIEAHSLTIIKIRDEKTDLFFCRNCQRDVRFFSFTQAALICHISNKFLETLIHTDQIHTVSENTVCADSLAAYFKHKIRFVED